MIVRSDHNLHTFLHTFEARFRTYGQPRRSHPSRPIRRRASCAGAGRPGGPPQAALPTLAPSKTPEFPTCTVECLQNAAASIAGETGDAPAKILASLQVQTSRFRDHCDAEPGKGGMNPYRARMCIRDAAVRYVVVGKLFEEARNDRVSLKGEPQAGIATHVDRCNRNRDRDCLIIGQPLIDYQSGVACRVRASGAHGGSSAP